MKTIFARIFNNQGRDIRIWHGDDNPPPAGLSKVGQPWIDPGNATNPFILKIFNGTQYTRGESVPVAVNTAGNKNITAAQILAGIYERNPAGGNRTDALPDADDLVAGITNPYVGQILDFWVINTAGAANTVAIAAGAGGTLKPAAPAAIAQNQARLYKIRITNITAGTEAYDVYAIAD